MVVTPISTRTAASEICAASAQAAQTPMSAPGSVVARIAPLQSLR